jgi:hypothetical protein
MALLFDASIIVVYFVVIITDWIVERAAREIAA